MYPLRPARVHHRITVTITTQPDAAALIADLQRRLDGYASSRTRQWWEGYLKGDAAFRGVPTGKVRDAVTAWHVAHRLHGRAAADQLDLALALLREPMSEDKLAGILMLQEILLPAGLLDCDAVDAFAGLFDEGHIADWNVCDWLCVRVLGPLVERYGASCARAIADWKDADNVWRCRAAAVAFVNLASRGDEVFDGLVELLLDVCDATVRHPDRFVQTGTAWALRELALAAPEPVAAFLREHRARLSPEALASVVKKLDDPLAAELLATAG